jgi:hypothetical protein
VPFPPTPCFVHNLSFLDRYWTADNRSRPHIRFFDFSDAAERAVREARMMSMAPVRRLQFAVNDSRTQRLKEAFRRSLQDSYFSPSSDEHGIATWSDPDLAALDKLAVGSRNRE